MSDVNKQPKSRDVNEWGLKLHNEKLIVAGPCSAESEEQVMAIAKALKSQGYTGLFRAGLWKPRTRPNSFEGMGSTAIDWMKKVKEEVGLPITTEVANAAHVEQALEGNFDVLWIGARTTVNPFAVQEIADAIKGVDIPVLVKNPINPELSLWIGALERLEKVGIKKLGAIHRGFSTHEKTKYRNKPQWSIPIELKRNFPDMCIICDPSHITGKRDMIPAVSQKAIDLNFSGMMIEVHNNPDVALSDAAQQLTPDVFGNMLENLIWRKQEISDIELQNHLEILREQIDGVDEDIVNLMARRMELSTRIGSYKRDNKITILQEKRWDNIVRSRTEAGKIQGLSSEFIERVYRAIHQESIRTQETVMKEKEAIN